MIKVVIRPLKYQFIDFITHWTNTYKIINLPIFSIIMYKGVYNV